MRPRPARSARAILTVSPRTVPELPEVEYVVRRLREYADRAAIARLRILHPRMARPQSSRAVEAKHRGARVLSYQRRAKNILIHLDNGFTTRVHLGMTGHIYWTASPDFPSSTRAVFALAAPAGYLVFEDSRMFGRVTVHRTDSLPELLAGYGPEPLAPDFTWQVLKAAAAGLRTPLKPFLLDQRRVAGLGNIWAAEALFVARLDPRRRVDTLADPDWRRLRHAIYSVLDRAVTNTFKVTSRPEEFPDADLLTVKVYGRQTQPCRRCRTPIQRLEQAARSTYFCPRCQT